MCIFLGVTGLKEVITVIIAKMFQSAFKLVTSFNLLTHGLKKILDMFWLKNQVLVNVKEKNIVDMTLFNGNVVTIFIIVA